MAELAIARVARKPLLWRPGARWLAVAEPEPLRRGAAFSRPGRRARAPATGTCTDPVAQPRPPKTAQRQRPRCPRRVGGPLRRHAGARRADRDRRP
eukprot:scaffold6214_cov104-Isochrysis_galbana.AAC.1